ncbi:MAG: hypothetical protein ACR2MQ_00360 [Gemmatimonadaceae bacterium]
MRIERFAPWGETSTACCCLARDAIATRRRFDRTIDIAGSNQGALCIQQDGVLCGQSVELINRGDRLGVR